MSEVKSFVQKRYGNVAKEVMGQAEPASGGCCSSAEKDPISVQLYFSEQMKELPQDALEASLGCGNPTALAELHEGEVVLDLGSGGGIDVLLSAKRVGPTGKAYGLDMTDEMLELAEKNRAASGMANVEFLKGEIENIPLPDNSVDVIISNCVINLSGDKDSVIREAFRVLKPGGRFAVADIVIRHDLPEEVFQQVDFWTGCVSGALQQDDYKARLTAAGFVDADIQEIRTYSPEDASAMLATKAAGGVTAEVAEKVASALFSGFVRARKPS